LAKSLLRKGAIVFGIIRNRADNVVPKNLKDRALENKVHLLEGDICDLYSIIRALDFAQPEFIFHLAAQSFVKGSFDNPLIFTQANCIGTANLLEAVRLRCPEATVVFAGTSEEYGLAFSSKKQYERIKAKYKNIFPEPEFIPELPVKETNPLRPMSPYAVSKVYGDYLMREYHSSFGLKTIISRAFNHEGAGRGPHFVTSVVARQTAQLKYGEIDKIIIGNVNTFRDWSHVKDIVEGYLLLAEKGAYGDVYVQGSMRTNSVLTYLLLALEEVGYKVHKIATIRGNKSIEEPVKIEKLKMFGAEFEVSKVDKLLLQDMLYFDLDDKGLVVHTDKGEIKVVFDKERFRPSDVPILMSDPSKIMKLGFKINHSLREIVRDQLDFFLSLENRNVYNKL
ncbi:MAG: GDP-mannose 4,6 dehydratase, partial [Candidatus Latescibacterota bacterium]